VAAESDGAPGAACCAERSVDGDRPAVQRPVSNRSTVSCSWTG
jgi:hypothetical protein